MTIDHVVADGKNFVRAYGLAFWRAYYFYLDKVPYIADGKLARRGLRVRFIGGWSLRDCDYEVVSCWVPIWQAGRFEECMGELATASMFEGRDDYAEKCRELSWLFDR